MNKLFKFLNFIYIYIIKIFKQKNISKYNLFKLKFKLKSDETAQYLSFNVAGHYYSNNQC